MTALIQEFTSTGSKLFYHQEAMAKLRNGKGQPIVTHVMATDKCNHACAFCSVQMRAGDALPLYVIDQYLNVLKSYGLKAVILSGGGNPILYKCPESKSNFNVLVDLIYAKDLEIGLITNGIVDDSIEGRMTWKNIAPNTLDKLTWVRISMAGLDHAEKKVFVPEINRSKTTLGFSYVFHDVYECPEEPHHKKVSTVADLKKWVPGISDAEIAARKIPAEMRAPWIEQTIRNYVYKYNPAYVRLLPNCLEPNLIADRCLALSAMANRIDPNVVFVQYKPPQAPNVCLLGYIHPVLNTDGYVYPCDSCVLNEAADHQFNKPWRVCHWSEVASMYDNPIKSLVDPKKLCPGCVFSKSNGLLENIAGSDALPHPSSANIPQHVNFV